MGVKIVQKETKFLSELVNGSNFDENLEQNTPTLADGVTGRCKAVTTVEVTVGMNISNFQILYADSEDQSNTNPLYKIVKDDASFVNEGITLGSQIALTFDPFLQGGLVLNVFLIVTALTETELFVTYDGKGDDNDNDISLATLHEYVNNQNNPAGENISVYGTPGYIAVDPSFTALEFSYNLIENSSGNPSLVSPLTNTTNVIKVKLIPTSPSATVRTGSSTSKNKAAVMGDVTVEFKDRVYNNNALLQLKFSNRYEITHEFIVPYYFDGEEDNIDDTTTPPDLYNGTSSPKYIYQTTWYTDINDPNTGSTGIYDTSKGNSGYFDEAFNGEENPYTVSNLVYFDVTDSLTTDRLNIGKRTRITFDVTNSESDFTPSQLGVIVHGAIVDSDKYSSSTDKFPVVWTFETLRTSASDAVIVDSGGLIKNYKINYNNSGSISVVVEVEFTDTQNGVLEENQPYLVAFQVRNDLETIVSESHKVHLKIDRNNYGKNNDIDGLFGVARFEQIPHPVSVEPVLNDTIGYTNGQYDIEEGALSLTEFWLDTSKDAKLDELKFQIGVFNQSSQEIHVLRETNIDLSDAILVGDVWQLNLNETIGYPLKDGDQFNYKKLITGELVGSKQFYTLVVGYRIPWQEWLAFAAAPTSFFNFEEQHNGLNQKASNYSLGGNYQIRLFVDAKVSQDGISTDYVTSSNNIDCYDYDSDESVGNDTYTCSVGTFDVNDTPIENNMIKDGFTKIKAFFTPKIKPIFSESVDFTLVSTIYDPVTNPLGWIRYAHGNKFDIAINQGPRDGVWANEQANDDDDTFTDGTSFFTKSSNLLYTSTSSTITADENCNALYGCVSTELYESYTITGEMFSTFTDDDVIAYNIAFMTDEFGVEHTISLCATTGGVLLDLGGGFVLGDDSTTTIEYNNPKKVASWALVYDFAKSGAKQLTNSLSELMEFNTSQSGFDWGDAQVEDLFFNITRTSNDISVTVDWRINAVDFNNVFNYNLLDDVVTKKFIGANQIAFSFMSQVDGGFKNVVIAIPQADYWAVNRIETEGSKSDNGLFELSTDIEGDTKNLLKNLPTEDLILSSIEWADPSFIVQSLIQTNKIKEGEKYKISSEIGLTNLGFLDLLSTFAWVDSADRSKLYVQFNTSINLATVTTTGLSILLNGLTITGYVLGESESRFAVFTLSGDIEEGDNNTFVYDGTNTIASDDDSITLSPSSIKIYDI